MAKINLVLAALLVSVLFFSFGIKFTEERILKVEKLDETGKVGVTDVNRHILEEDSSAGNVNGNTVFSGDDFQPTTPGHSPGAGHSNGPASNDNN
ncbi:hypothetical protein F3Y22_tig00112649pilonHSYRG00036 [Hibiscus syriacus]|uniref:Uncharacterized protein n=1 Tax=Hibiscus syriacus TaxID=106335 RepID=A0A6A2XD35_HIBSY|nr:hypothetical protein F3Y22_tig00112649pilonHSYRG00036 [Hibiscus syriacus]